MTEWKRKKGSAPPGEGSGVTIGTRRGGGGTVPVPGLTFGTGTETAPSPGWTKGVGQQGPGQMAIGGSRVKQEWSKGTGGQQGPARIGMTVRDPIKRFEQLIVDDTAPADGTEAQTRVDELISLLETLIPGNRKKIADSKTLMTKARKWVGNEQYMALAAAAGVFASKPTAKDGKPTGDVNHMTGSEADTFIKTAMSGVPHLKVYLEEAVAAGRKGDGFIAVLDDDDWNAVYPEEFPSEPVGSEDETTTNAFVSNVKRGPAILNKARGTRSTAIHESMHRYAEDDVNNVWGFDLNEGITEYFTRLISDRNGEPAKNGGPERDNYDDNIKFVRRSLLKVLGGDKNAQEIVLAEINFKGKTDLLKEKVLAYLAGKGHDDKKCAQLWKRLDGYLRGGDWSKARKILA